MDTTHWKNGELSSYIYEYNRMTKQLTLYGPQRWRDVFGPRKRWLAMKTENVERVPPPWSVEEKKKKIIVRVVCFNLNNVCT